MCRESSVIPKNDIMINFLIVLTSFGVVVPSEEKEHPRHLKTRKFRRSAQQGKTFLTCIIGNNIRLIDTKIQIGILQYN